MLGILVQRLKIITAETSHATCIGDQASDCRAECVAAVPATDRIMIPKKVRTNVLLLWHLVPDSNYYSYNQPLFVKNIYRYAGQGVLF
tara:strand:+ start:561 stop:824 length:264 start_codon:yes stop_codon:yes gene_type:complete